MGYELGNCPPLTVRRPCGPCGRDVDVAVSPTGTVEACPHVGIRLRQAVRERPDPYELWGGRLGYAVAPLGAVLFLRGGGYRYAAPFQEGRTVHVVGEHSGVYVAIALHEDDWRLPLRLVSPALPRGETPEGLGLKELAARLLIGFASDPASELILFQPLRPFWGADAETGED